MQGNAPFRARFDEVFRRHVRFMGDDRRLSNDDDLATSGLDSAGVIDLLIDIEETFSVSLPEALLTPETFRTRATLERVIAMLVGVA